MPQAEALRKVAVVGAGLMGHGIAQVFALSGREVILTDARAEALPRAQDGIAKNLNLFVKHELVSRAEADAALRRLSIEPSFERAVEPADYVVEAVYEDLPLQQRVFADL